MVCLRSTWWMTASLSLPPAADDFDHPTSLSARFQPTLQIWESNHSLFLDRIAASRPWIGLHVMAPEKSACYYYYL